MPDAEEVLVLGECLQGDLAPITGEIIAAGRQLADQLGIGVACGLIGHGIDRSGRVALTLGADRAYVIDDPLLASFQPELYLAGLTKLCQAINPRVLLMARTPIDTTRCDPSPWHQIPWCHAFFQPERHFVRATRMAREPHVGSPQPSLAPVALPHPIVIVDDDNRIVCQRRGPRDRQFSSRLLMRMAGGAVH